MLDNIAVDDSNLIDVVFSELSGNLRDIAPERFKRICTLVVVAHPAGWHKVGNIVRSCIFGVLCPLRLKMIDLHILDVDSPSAVGTVTVILRIDRFPFFLTETHFDASISSNAFSASSRLKNTVLPKSLPRTEPSPYSPQH